MIYRDRYIEKIISYMSCDLVKIVTGVRRCGKSSILLLLKDYLLEQGVDKNHIIEINYEEYKYKNLRTEDPFREYIAKKVVDNQKTYFLIDEIQELEEWGRVINSLRVDYNCDIYVTGSNSRMFSGEHVTYISGRYIEIKVLPLSFKEFLDFKSYNEENLEKHFEEYLRIGSFPAVSLVDSDELVEAVLSGIFDSIFSRDILLRGKIKNEAAFFKVARFILENIGNSTSANKIRNTLSTNGHKMSSDTVDNYLKLMCDAHILYQCERYDIRGKERLRSNGKYYVVDMGLRNRLVGYKQGNIGHIIENIVYLELLRKDYEISVGKNMTTEVDFIAVKTTQIIYIQVSTSVKDEIIYEREITPLIKIKDNYPKYLITMDSLDFSINGIVHINLLDFLLGKVSI